MSKKNGEETELVKQEGGTLSRGMRFNNDVAQGGVSAKDFTVPRALLLQEDKSTHKAGEIVNSISDERVAETIIPLMPYKSYVKFNKDLEVEWVTVNRNDERVVSALKDVDWD